MFEPLQNQLIYVAYAALISVVVYAVVMILHISGKFDERKNRREYDLVVAHYEEIKNIYQMIRGWRHDYKNHIQVMSALVEMKKIDELQEYLKGLSNDLDSIYEFVRTGNAAVDAVISSKIDVCKVKDIPYETKLLMPANCLLKDIDLCIILSNLLDNAIEACEKIDNAEDRFVKVIICVLRDHLYISVINSIKEPPKKKGDVFISTKGENHGFGLHRIDRTVHKYSGFVNRSFKEDSFTTEIMIPLELK